MSHKMFHISCCGRPPRLATPRPDCRELLAVPSSRADPVSAIGASHSHFPHPITLEVDMKKSIVTGFIGLTGAALLLTGWNDVASAGGDQEVILTKEGVPLKVIV